MKVRWKLFCLLLMFIMKVLIRNSMSEIQFKEKSDNQDLDAYVSNEDEEEEENEAEKNVHSLKKRDTNSQNILKTYIRNLKNVNITIPQIEFYSLRKLLKNQTIIRFRRMLKITRIFLTSRG